jgi:hypothetical protein
MFELMVHNSKNKAMDAAECNRNMVVDFCMLVWQADIYFEEEGLLLPLLLFVRQDGIFLTIAFINRSCINADDR